MHVRAKLLQLEKSAHSERSFQSQDRASTVRETVTTKRPQSELSFHNNREASTVTEKRIQSQRIVHSHREASTVTENRPRSQRSVYSHREASTVTENRPRSQRSFHGHREASSAKTRKPQSERESTVTRISACRWPQSATARARRPTARATRYRDRATSKHSDSGLEHTAYMHIQIWGPPTDCTITFPRVALCSNTIPKIRKDQIWISLFLVKQL